MRTIGSVVAALTLSTIALGGGATLSTRQAQQPPGGRATEPTGRTGLPDTDEEGQPRKLPPLPSGMTTQMLVQGDSIFHGKGGCVTCHGPDATGMPNAGSALTRGTSFVPTEWQPIEMGITAGIPEAFTRSGIAMPARGAQSNLTPDEVRLVAAYVWAIASVRDEPWPGGHRTHTSATQGARADTTGKAAPAGAPTPTKP